MDDVYVVIGLLLFGSLLFCLCCYKISNLLYMLYHIDDVSSNVVNDVILANGGGAVGAPLENDGVALRGQAGPHGASGSDGYNFVSEYTAATNAAASGNIPDIRDPGGHKDSAALLIEDIGTNKPDYVPNHVPSYHFHHQHQHPNLYSSSIKRPSSRSSVVGMIPQSQKPGLRPAGSVTSLNKGIQCPDDEFGDIRTSSETCLLPTSSFYGSGYNPAALNNCGPIRGYNRLHSHQQQQYPYQQDITQQQQLNYFPHNPHPSRVHLSDPDFRRASAYDLHLYQQRHGNSMNRSHPYSRPYGCVSVRDLNNDDNSTPSAYMNQGSLDHSRLRNGGEVWRQQRPTASSSSASSSRFVNQPSSVMPNTRLSERGSATRRYGSIRVAECSFIEHRGRSPSSSPTTANLDMDLDTGRYNEPFSYHHDHHHHHHTQHLKQNPDPPPQHHRFGHSTFKTMSGADDAKGSSGPYATPNESALVRSSSSRVPNGNQRKMETCRTHQQQSQSQIPRRDVIGGTSSQAKQQKQQQQSFPSCNGPRLPPGGGASTSTGTEDKKPQHQQHLQSKSGKVPPVHGHPHHHIIIPPPQNFGDFHQHQKRKV